jgi:N-terminal acetyltransferase B complex catalytic subunit
MDLLEKISEKVHNAFFVDLFVRESNSIAVGMYKSFGYVVYYFLKIKIGLSKSFE